MAIREKVPSRLEIRATENAHESKSEGKGVEEAVLYESGRKRNNVGKDNCK